jgi:transcriptional regulator with XRE-family HTH domain
MATIRQRRGLTQAELEDAVGVSQRVIAYYETETDQPPGALLVDLAKALRVSADQLLGLAPVREQTKPKTGRLLEAAQEGRGSSPRRPTRGPQDGRCTP